MCEVISVLVSVCMCFGICVVAASQDKSREKLDRLCCKMDTVTLQVAGLHNRMEDRRRFEISELQHRRNEFLAHVRVDHEKDGGEF